MNSYLKKHLVLIAAGAAALAGPTTLALGSGPSEAAAHTCGGRAATIVGNSHNNEINGTAGSDVIVGLGGNDDIEGHGGNDIICGNRGNDELEGDSGNDRLYGGLGFDEAEGGRGSDTCFAEEKESC